MGRPAEQIEALQARVAELEGRCRALEGRLAAYEPRPVLTPEQGQRALAELRAQGYSYPAVDAPPPVLVAGDALDEDEAPTP